MGASSRPCRPTADPHGRERGCHVLTLTLRGQLSDGERVLKPHTVLSVRDTVLLSGVTTANDRFVLLKTTACSMRPPQREPARMPSTNLVNEAHEVADMRRRSEDISTDALDDVAYLTRSPNRVRILDALARGRYTRRELAEVTESSRTTLDRIVNELEERGWAHRTTDGTYAATATGTHLMEEVRPFLDSVEAIRNLGDAVAWLPADELSIGLHHFSDASVLRPEQGDPMETVDYFVDLIRDTADFRVLTHFAPPVPLARTMRDRIVAGELTAEYVLTDALVEYLRERPERRERWRDILEGGADVFRVHRPLPCNLWTFDRTVLIKKSGPGADEASYGVPVHSENEAVRSWAGELIDLCRTDGTPVDVETFAEEPVAS